VSRPAGEQPTTVLPQQTVEQPSVTTSPATGRVGSWHSRIPARIGRARTSTVVIGALFVLLGGLNVALSQEDSGTTQVVLPSGKTVDIPTSAIPSEDRPAPTPQAPTTPDPTGGVPVPTSAAPTDTRAPSSTPDDDEPATTTAPTSAPTSSPRDTSPTTSAPTSTARSTPTTSAPSTSGARSSAEPTAEGTAGPTG
jgi:hypothetical protein